MKRYAGASEQGRTSPKCYFGNGAGLSKMLWVVPGRLLSGKGKEGTFSPGQG